MSSKIPQHVELPGIAVGSELPRPKTQVRSKPRVKAVERSQQVFEVVDVDQLVEPDHPVRAIWEFVGRLDLSPFYAPIEAVAGVAGREPWDPRLLISLWVYAYSRGLSSARELARRCVYEPAFRWLAGLGRINHHTLADFRSTYQEALPQLFVQVLGVLSAEGLVTLERVMHDGTKIKALAAKKSFRQQEALQEHLAAARKQVEALKDWQGDETARQRAARERAASERQQRVEQALGELEQLQQERGEAEAREIRVSQTDPQARTMKQPDGGYAPSYNVQLSTDAAHKIIVAAGVSQQGNDWGQLVPAVERVEQNCQAKPQAVVADAGYTNRSNIVEMETRSIEFIGSMRESAPDSSGKLARRGTPPEFYPQAFRYEAPADSYRCPVGTMLYHIGRKRRAGALQHTYRADARACEACPFQSQCCGAGATHPRLVIRVEDPDAVVRFKQKMQSETARMIYRQRSAVAEFPNAWIKEKLGLRRFRLRGLVKVGLEVLWACLTYNIQQWIRLMGAMRPASVAN